MQLKWDHTIFSIWGRTSIHVFSGTFQMIMSALQCWTIADTA